MPTAMEQVISVIKAALVGVGIGSTDGRDIDDFLQEFEIDTVDLSWAGAELSTPTSCDEYVWDATVQCGCWGKIKIGETPFAASTRIAGQVAAVISADYTFGGKFLQVTPMSVSGMEAFGSDVGCITVELRVQFMTSKGDWNTLIT
jgi:hypothetical protein